MLNVGTFALRKGVWDTAEVIGRAREPVPISVCGTSRTRSRQYRRSFEGTRRTFSPKQPEASLPAAYAWGDVFMLPTIEDGFQAVLAQAAAAGLPILTTPNGAGTDLVRQGRNGWVLPVRCPEAFLERLRWADDHRDELAAMARAAIRRISAS